jgi:D-arabinose 1-dehydrogenase-like Zn-dependent alcohol dehydrogenase
MESYDVVDWGKPLQKAIRATPAPQGTQVLVKLKYCGVCHSDVHIRDGYFDLGSGKRFNMYERGMKLPVTLGHEPYGTVVAAGPDALDAPIGQDRLVYPWTGCGRCARCADGMDNWCMQPRYIGVQSPGGYADHLLVPHPKYLLDASGIDPQFAPILACSGLTTYSAVRKLMPCTPKDWIVVLGAGGLGLMAVSMLRALGHENIAVADIDSAKWEAATRMGARLTLDPSNTDAAGKLQGLDGGLWGAVDLVGASQTASLAFNSLRKGGRYIGVGLFGGEIQIPLVTMIQRAMTFQGSYVGSLAELHEVVALAKAGKLLPIPVATCSLDEVSSIIDRLKAGTVTGRVVAKMN